MVKSDVIQMSGKVKEVLPDSKYRVQLETGHEVLGYLSGKMKQNRISITTGDTILIELTPYDLSRGRIVRRVNTNTYQPPTNRK